MEKKQRRRKNWHGPYKFIKLCIFKNDKNTFEILLPVVCAGVDNVVGGNGLLFVTPATCVVNKSKK